MPDLPVISGQKLISTLKKMGYKDVRQRGSQVRLEKKTVVGTHKITVPNHKVIAKGTLNDILAKISLWNQIPKNKLLEMLR